MQLLPLLLSSLLSLSFAADTAVPFPHEYSGVPTFMILSGGPEGSQAIGLLEPSPGRYAVAVTESDDYAHSGRGFLWRQTEAGQLCVRMDDDSLMCLRGHPRRSGKFILIAARPSEPLQTGQLDTWDIRCQRADSSEHCVIKLEGVMVPFRGSMEDQRSLVLDMDANGSGYCLLWPNSHKQNQTFTIAPIEL